MKPLQPHTAEELEREDEATILDSPTAVRTSYIGTPEERLWYEVLLANMRDFGWIGTSDFKIVCRFANINPEYILRKLNCTGA